MLSLEGIVSPVYTHVTGRTVDLWSFSVTGILTSQARIYIIRHSVKVWLGALYYV